MRDGRQATPLSVGGYRKRGTARRARTQNGESRISYPWIFNYLRRPEMVVLT